MPSHFVNGRRTSAPISGHNVAYQPDPGLCPTPALRTVVAAVDGDAWAGSASQVVELLAGRGHEVVRLPATAHASILARVADQYQAALIVIAAPAVGAA